jgi:hypothetical protein
MSLSADDPQGQARLKAFVQGVQQLGWTDGSNMRIDTRWSAGNAVPLMAASAQLMESPGLLGCRGFVDYSPLILCEGVRERHLSSLDAH